MRPILQTSLDCQCLKFVVDCNLMKCSASLCNVLYSTIGSLGNYERLGDHNGKQTQEFALSADSWSVGNAARNRHSDGISTGIEFKDQRRASR